MNPLMYQQLAEIEERHWWFVAKRELVKTLLKPYFRSRKQKAIDLGCGTGRNLKLLEKFCYQVVGFDKSPYALKIAKKKAKKNKLIHGDLNHLQKSFKANSFDLITMFSVLYHQWVKNDLAVLKQIYTILKPGGYFLINEPAFPCLFRQHDVLDLTKKRYTLREMRKLLKKTGFKLVKSTYFNSPSFLPALILSLKDRLAKKMSPKEIKNHISKELFMPPEVINRLLIKILNLETKVIQHFGRIPFGVNLLYLAKK